MPSEYLPVHISPTGSLDPSSAAARLLTAFFNGRKAETIKAYQADLEDFRAFEKSSTLEQAAHSLLKGNLGQANALVLDYKAHLVGRQLTPATINRRLAALRSFVKLARMLGLVPWKLEVEGMKSEGYRDTRGPGRMGFRDMLHVLDRRKDTKAVRDRASCARQTTVSFVHPLMIGTYQFAEVTCRHGANPRAAMPARIEVSAHFAGVIPDYDQGIITYVESEVVTRFRYLTRVAGKEPTAAEYPLQVKAKEFPVGIELLR